MPMGQQQVDYEDYPDRPTTQRDINTGPSPFFYAGIIIVIILILYDL